MTGVQTCALPIWAPLELGEGTQKIESDRPGKDTILYSNPNKVQIDNLLFNSGATIRIMRNENNGIWYAWNAMFIIHQHMARHLDVDWRHMKNTYTLQNDEKPNTIAIWSDTETNSAVFAELNKLAKSNEKFQRMFKGKTLIALSERAGRVDKIIL